MESAKLDDLLCQVVHTELLPAEKKLINHAERLLGYSFKNKQLLLEALTHRSAFNRLKDLKRQPYNYERLEFLGDAVLQLVISEFLFKHRSRFSEGIMTKIRASLVNTERLAESLRNVHINRLIVLGLGEAKDKGYNKNHILAAVFEAIVGAMYLDGGIRKVKGWIKRVLWTPYFQRIVDNLEYIDPKMALQELTQKHLGVLPEYELISRNGQEYKVRVKIHGKEYARASSRTLKKAQKLAAQKAFKSILTKIKS